MAAHEAHAHHDAHGHHHHEEGFVSKYIFSQDHKVIAKQFLITGIIWAVVGALFSVLFRLQLGYPDQTFPFLETIFGKWASRVLGQWQRRRPDPWCTAQAWPLRGEAVESGDPALSPVPD